MGRPETISPLRSSTCFVDKEKTDCEMRLKHTEPIIEPGHPFKYCSTGREEAGKSLTSIVGSINHGGAIALTGEWGTGKTTFLRMWKQSLEDQHYPTVLLNAWETEWAGDPLIAVIACIKRTCKQKESKEALNDVISVARGFVQWPIQMARTIGRAVVDHYAGEVSQAIEELADQAFDKAVDSFDGRERSMITLKGALEKLAWDVNQGSEDGKPLVFIIDELDRCRPDYAVRMLEVLKHFFVVRNIVFVCAVDKKHLEDSICGFYGSEKINAAEYLRRFFELEINLPSPDYPKFCEHLYDYYQLAEFFESQERKQYSIFRNNPEDFKWFLSSLGVKKGLSLRQLERITAFTKLSLRNMGARTYYYPTLSLFVTYLRFFDYQFYAALKDHKWSCQELLDAFQTGYLKLLDRKPNQYNSRSDHEAMILLLGKLIVSYNNDRETRSENIYDSTTKKTNLSPNESQIKKEELDRAIEYGNHGHDDYELSWLFRVLELLRIS